MLRRLISTILLLSMIAYGGGVARALHYATAHGCEHGAIDRCSLPVISAPSSCCGHHAHAKSHHTCNSHQHAHDDASACGEENDCESHEHDCDTCEMLLKIAASVDRLAPIAFAATQHVAVVTCRTTILPRRLAKCSGGPRAPPTVLS